MVNLLSDIKEWDYLSSVATKSRATLTEETFLKAFFRHLPTRWGSSASGHSFGIETRLNGNQELKPGNASLTEVVSVAVPQLCGYLCPDGHFDLGRSLSGPLLSMPGLGLAALPWRGRRGRPSGVGGVG